MGAREDREDVETVLGGDVSAFERLFYGGKPLSFSTFMRWIFQLQLEAWGCRRALSNPDFLVAGKSCNESFLCSLAN